MFSPDLPSELLKHIEIHDHTIDDKQPSYEHIYSLELVELETLKAYIETNLVNGYIKLSKLPAGTFICFDQKLDRSLWLCVDYRGFNKLTI